MTLPRTFRAVLAAVVVLAPACTGDGSDEPPTTTSTRRPTTTAAPTTTTTTLAPSNPDLTGVTVAFEPVADLANPTDLAVRPDDDTLYLLEREGRVRAVRRGELDPEPVLDISGEVSTDGEQGLLGIAFSPDGGHVYLNWTDRAGATHVTEIAVAADGGFDAASRRDLLVIEQPSDRHNGGDLAFGPDGHLYVAVGYGANDLDEGDLGQRLDTLLGKILRIQPTPGSPQPYSVPTDNPFLGQEGARPEIWVLGVRNPWRIAFDPPTGDLWIGDVGQFVYEEVNRLPAGAQAGANLGWGRLEGARPFRGRTPPEQHVLPLHVYNHDEGGCAVTGGFVYRGSGIPGLAGAYIFSDLCHGRILALTHEGGENVQVHDLGEGLPAQVSFGVDHDGELYVLSFGGGVRRLAPGPEPSPDEPGEPDPTASATTSTS